jgi:S1-C subfamily serine protease
LELEDKGTSKLEEAVLAICHSKPSLKNIAGTGFIATPTGLIITADHVITDSKGQVFKKLFALRPKHPEVEPFVLKVLKRFRKGLKGRDIAILKIVSDPLVSNFPYIPIGGKVEAGDPILIVGFPLVFEKVNIWPFFRTGIVASTRYKYEESAVLILDLGSIPGYSGSPVISMKTQEAVGVFKGHPEERPQTDFAIATTVNQNDVQPLE